MRILKWTLTKKQKSHWVSDLKQDTPGKHYDEVKFSVQKMLLFEYKKTTIIQAIEW